LTSGAEPVTNSPTEYAALIKTEIERWTKVVTETGVRAQ